MLGSGGLGASVSVESNDLSGDSDDGSVPPPKRLGFFDSQRRLRSEPRTHGSIAVIGAFSGFALLLTQAIFEASSARALWSLAPGLRIAALVAFGVAGLFGTLWLRSMALDDVYLERQRRLEEDLAEARQKLAEATSPSERSAAAGVVTQLEGDTLRAAPAVRFAEERTNATRSSAALFSTALAIVAAVVGVGLFEWIAFDPAESIDFPAALARVAVITAAFYLAGQLFKRSTVQSIRAQEFRRASIAMEVTDHLAEKLDEADASRFRRTIYEHHLTGIAPTADSGEDTNATDFSGIAKVIEAVAKGRN